MKKSLICQDESSNKFWNIEVTGKSFTVTFGKIGTKGQSQTKEFESEDKCTKEAEKLIREKTMKGYKEDGDDIIKTKNTVPLSNDKDENHIEPTIQHPLSKPVNELATGEQEPLVWDLRDPDGPMLGRLRGVAARHELWGLYNDTTIYAKPGNAHFVLRRPAPAEWPDLLTNEQLIPVVSKRLRDAIHEIYPDLEFWEVRLHDEGGAQIAIEYYVAVILKLANCINRGDSTIFGNDYRWVHEYLNISYQENENPAPLFWGDKWLLLAQPKLVRHLQQKNFTNVRFVRISDYSGLAWEIKASSYELLNTGFIGADLEFNDSALYDLESKISKGLSICDLAPSKIVVAMRPPKSRKKLVDVMKTSRCLLISERIKNILDEAGADGIEYFETTILDHDKKTMDARYYLVNVLKTVPYVDIEESSIGWYSNKIWTVYDLVVDEGRLTEKPVLFRLGPDAAYSWYFMRSDILDKLESIKATGGMSTAVSLLVFAEKVDSL